MCFYVLEVDGLRAIRAWALDNGFLVSRPYDRQRRKWDIEEGQYVFMVDLKT
jgi:hypothetical protein